MLKWLIVTLSIAVVFGLICRGNALAADETNLVAYWSFDQDSDETVPDDSGNGHDGNIVDAEWVAAGKFGGAMDFNGTGAFVDVASHPDLNPANDDWTVEAWIKRADTVEPAGNSGWQKILTKYPGAWNGYRIGLLNSAVHVIFGAGEASKVEFTSVTKIADTEWHHVGFVADRAGDITIYIDGEPDQQTSVEHVEAVNVDQNLEIGRCHWCGGGAIMGFFGTLDEIKIWRAALTQEEISLSMEGEFGANKAVEANGKLATTWGGIKH
jgi:hypothetical protein